MPFDWAKGKTKENNTSIAKAQKSRESNPEWKTRIIKNLPPPKINISKEELSKLYWNDNLSQYDIAKKLKISQSRVSQLMKKYDIKNRGRVEGSKRLTKNSRYRKNRKIAKALKGNTNWRFSHQFPNSEEKKIIKFFKRWNLPFKYVGDGSFKIGGKNPDFIYEKKKAIIEFFGELWHEKLDEPERINFFKEHGWYCIVIWGKEARGKLRSDRIQPWERRLYDKIVRWLAGLP